MGGPLIIAPPRYALTPWSDIQPSDLREQGEPEVKRDIRRQRFLVLRVKGQYVEDLGHVALRCERYGDVVVPMMIAIPDTPITFDEGDGA